MELLVLQEALVRLEFLEALEHLVMQALVVPLVALVLMEPLVHQEHTVVQEHLVRAVLQEHLVALVLLVKMLS